MVPEKDARRPFWVGLFIFLTLIVPALIGYDIYSQWHAPTMDFLLDSPGSSIVYDVIPGGSSDAAGLQAGDVILSIDDTAPEYWYSPQLGQTHIVEIERGGEQLTLGIPAVSVFQVSVFSLVTAIVIVLVFWGISTVLLWRRFLHTEIRLLFLLSQTIAIALLFPLSYQDPWAPPLELLSISVAGFNLAAPLLLHYVITFPVKLGHTRQRFWGLLPLYGLALFVFLGCLPNNLLGMQLSILFFGVVTTLAIFLMIYVYFYRAGLAERRRSRVVVAGTLMAGLPPLLLYLLPTSLQSPYVMPEWGAGLFLIIAPLSYLYATLRHNLFGIDRLINRALVYTTLSLAIFILYLGPYLLLYRYLPDDPFVQLVIVSGLTLWIGWTFDRMRKRVQQAADRLFYGGWYDYPAVVETVSDALARSTQREQILDVLTRQVPDMMQLRNVDVWIGEAGAALPPSSSQGHCFEFKSDVPAQWTVGPHQDGDDLSDADQRILRTLAQQAEIALNNVFLIERLRHQLDEIQASREALAQVQHQLLRSREEERARLARDLHDGPIQSLVGLNIQLGLMLSSHEIAPPVGQSLKEIRAEVRQLSVELRHVCAELRPPMLDTLGLGAALRAHADEWSAQYGVKTQLDVPPDATLRSLPGEVAVNLYRVAQEVLVNVGKHARAQQVDISLTWQDSRLIMTIQDDGQGFEPSDTLYNLTAQNHFGLAGMQERVDLIGGRWSLKSAPGKGTTVCITWKPEEISHNEQT
ncbi:MAG: hypothetical protein JXB30_19930 [Anaerolineae bacterium]|nr:hypothetical protein [Anaerolineae bacterium]